MGCGSSKHQEMERKLAQIELNPVSKSIVLDQKRVVVYQHQHKVGPFYTADINNEQYSYFESRFKGLLVKELEKSPEDIQFKSKDDLIISVLRKDSLRKKIFNFIRRKGVDHQYRWTVWRIFSSSNNTTFRPDMYLLDQRKRLYPRLVAMENREVVEIVDKDVLRTARHKDLFQALDSVGTTCLYNVCKAIGCFFPKVGYVQGMNFIVAFVLEVSGMEEFESFNFLINFWKKRKNMYYSL